MNARRWCTPPGDDFRRRGEKVEAKMDAGLCAVGAGLHFIAVDSEVRGGTMEALVLSVPSMAASCYRKQNGRDSALVFGSREER
jgi:hypothetical protein